MSSLEERRLAKAFPGLIHVAAPTGPRLPSELGSMSWGCCDGAAYRGLDFCTCWEPVYDLEQADPIPGVPATREKCCFDCAYLQRSPEREQGYDDELVDITRDARFFCHQGMRRVVGWRHPGFEEIDEFRSFFPDGLIPAGDGDYRPPIVGGVAYRADGTTADLCGGWAAHRRTA